jgi:hypothetical protein
LVLIYSCYEQDIREHIGEHTCDKRKTATYLKTDIPTMFPRSSFTCEEGMSEEDELWKPDYRETDAEVAARAKRAIEQIWQSTQGISYVSITAHSGWINGVLEAVGRPWYSLPTGGILPIVLRRVQ